MAQSGFERDLQFQMKAVQLPAPEIQYRFASPRRWTFDFAWPARKFYVEVEGGIWIRGGGRHNRAKGFEADTLKYGEAAILGWRGLRVTTGQVKSGVAHFAQIGTDRWWRRMHEAMRVICDDAGHPRCRLHGLRMLDPRIFSKFPLASAYSTKIGRNIGIDQAWHGPYAPPTKESRVQVMRARVESINAPNAYAFQPQQGCDDEQYPLLRQA